MHRLSRRGFLARMTMVGVTTNHSKVDVSSLEISVEALLARMTMAGVTTNYSKMDVSSLDFLGGSALGRCLHIMLECSIGLAS
jgi:hypothetical protein